MIVVNIQYNTMLKTAMIVWRLSDLPQVYLSCSGIGSASDFNHSAREAPLSCEQYEDDTITENCVT